MGHNQTMLDDIQFGVLRTYQIALGLFYALAVAISIGTEWFDESIGESAAIVACALGLLVLHVAPGPLARRMHAALAFAMIAVPLAVLWHAHLAAQVWALVPSIFFVMYIRSFYPAGTARLLIAGQAAALNVALFFSPAAVPWLWYVTFPAAILVSSELFGALSAATIEVALHDPLTGLCNRAGADRLAGRMFDRSGGCTIGAIMVDVDGFKQVNDTDGHTRGDQVLVNLARQLEQRTPDAGFAARWGGDEFIIVAPVDDVASMHAVADWLCRNAVLPVSVGVALVDSGDATLDELVHRADVDLYARRAVAREVGPE